MRVSPVERAAQDQAQRINDLLAMRASLDDALTKAVIEGLEAWVQVAQNPGHPAYGPARYWVGRLVRVVDQARAVTAGLEVASKVPGAGNGRA